MQSTMIHGRYMPGTHAAYSGSGIASTLDREINTGNVYYVATNGNDSRTPTQAKSSSTPWATIQHAAGVVIAGDTVHVAPGTYNSAVSIHASGTSSARITFISDTSWGAKIFSPSSAGEIAVEIGNDANSAQGNYIDFVGFDVSGDSSACWLGILVWGSNCRVIGNYVHDIPATSSADNGGAGIDVGYTANTLNNSIIGNVVARIGPEPSAGLNEEIHGIYVSANGGFVQNNICYHNAGWGICSFHGEKNWTISNNTVFENGAGILIASGGTGVGTGTGDNNTVSNNIIVYNLRYGIDDRDQVGTHNVYLNNCIYNNGSGASNLSSGNTLQNTLVSNPMFVNWQADGTGDYRLASGSPCIGAGTATGAPATDFLGVTRPNPPSIGPYEYPN